jgi:flagellar export protein FliJ
MMRPRPFRLDTVLRVRRREEELRARELAEVQRALQAIQRRLDSLGEEQQRVMLTARDVARERAFLADDVQRYFQYERHLSRLATEADARLAELRAEAEKRRAALEEAMKRRRMLERLQERHGEQLEAWRNHELQKAADEAAGNQVALRRRGYDRA